MNIVVLDANGQRVSMTSEKKAQRLLEQGKATLVSCDPFVIRLPYAVDLPARPEPEVQELPGKGKHILLHVCCAPCATYPAKRLRELGFEVTGYWYNPNIHPFGEHERRRETLAQYAHEIDLPVIWEPGYEIVDFMRAIGGQEAFGTRCRICYRMRLARAAQVAARERFEALTTTLLISPYQDQQAIRAIGQDVAAMQDVAFFYENFRRGWSEHAKMTREHGLYSQRYCGCVYSEWEARDRTAWTLKGKR
ncbi:MAG: epoxyqueuosine reductase QueH [Anaerolineae bacterium]|nr:epoxyqueuosine reductase QueH [Anaerolineae bacterium]